MRRIWIVEPLPDGWCRCFEVVSYGGRHFAGPTFWARTAKVLWGVDAERER
jgi:hypothetical protein